MKPNVITTPHRSLHAELAGMLRSAWRRFAVHAERESRHGAGQPAPRGARFGAGTLIAAAAIVAGGTLNVGVLLSLIDAPAIAAAPPRAAQSHTDGALQRRAAAVQSLRSQRYADAYGRFADLGDAGDAAAAVMALAMVVDGPVVFGSEWSATAGQLQRWSALAARDLRERSLLIAQHDRGE